MNVVDIGCGTGASTILLAKLLNARITAVGFLQVCPEIGVASAKIRVLEKHGYSPLDYFVLPERCWLDEYYRSMQ